MDEIPVFFNRKVDQSESLDNWHRESSKVNFDRVKNANSNISILRQD